MSKAAGTAVCRYDKRSSYERGEVLIGATAVRPTPNGAFRFKEKADNFNPLDCAGLTGRELQLRLFSRSG